MREGEDKGFFGRCQQRTSSKIRQRDGPRGAVQGGVACGNGGQGGCDLSAGDTWAAERAPPGSGSRWGTSSGTPACVFMGVWGFLLLTSRTQSYPKFGEPFPCVAFLEKWFIVPVDAQIHLKSIKAATSSCMETIAMWNATCLCMKRILGSVPGCVQ